MLVVFRDRPGRGHRHVVRQRDVHAFVSLLPAWGTLARGLDAVLLAENERGCDGWHVPGLVALCAWEAWSPVVRERKYVDDHADILDRLGVAREATDDPDSMLCHFSDNQARAFLLLHVLLHELGHHHDRMTTRAKLRSERGEAYAEAWARENEARVWERYTRTFEVF